MRKSKRDFSDTRGKKGDVSAWGKEFVTSKSSWSPLLEKGSILLSVEKLWKKLV